MANALTLVKRDSGVEKRAMRTTDEENTEARRAAIISAAVRCLTRNGVAKTGIRDICKEAAIRPGHLYYYFENKDALLVSILLGHQEQAIQSIEHMLEAEADLVSQIVDVHMQAESRRAAIGLTPIVRMELECYVSRLAAEGNFSMQGTHRMQDAVRSAIRCAVANGKLSKDVDIVRLANAIILIWEGITHSQLTPDFDIDEIRQTVGYLMAPGPTDWRS